ncbi:hypothetical protein So717_05310 [Roseobacter cerasinus]|uniref:Uncharacterized protein n=1 Tax=Roseobacter cerasinus TaxID=2602289 RepID=A0A640VJZ5_9RHOB|nr:hypothetical protein [Roseobacter cerasinus]GFE48778.1 hypothetical protein So717_05310 [Roseobacter cerasinus]
MIRHSHDKKGRVSLKQRDALVVGRSAVPALGTAQPNLSSGIAARARTLRTKPPQRDTGLMRLMAKGAALLRARAQKEIALGEPLTLWRDPRAIA